VGPGTVAATVPAGPPGRLGLFLDENSDKKFLIDTGSVYSIIPHQSSCPPTGPAIMTADKTAIPCWGVSSHVLRSGHRTFDWKFLQAAVAFPILGSDFLGAFNLKVDLRKMCLESGTGRWRIKMVIPPPDSTFAAIGAQPVVTGQRPSSDPPSEIQQGAGETEKGPPCQPGGPALHLEPRIPKAGEAKVVLAKVPKIHLQGGEGRARKKKTSHSFSKEYRDTPLKRRPSAAEKDVSPFPSQGEVAGNESSPCEMPPAAGAGATAGGHPGASDCVDGGRGQYEALLAKFPDVLNPGKELPPTKHHIQHIIVTEGNPVASRYRRLDPDRLQAAKAEFAALEKQGIIRRSKSHWATPLHMVKKADGSWRCCGDFRQLNLQTRPDRYSCPNLADLSAGLAGCTVFSKLDLRKGYHQVPVRPQDVPKTAVVTPFGLFEYLRMPFGLRNAGQTFQRLMDEVLAGLPFVFIYMDDVLVASRNHAEHYQHLQEVLARLQEHGLVLNGEKCVLGASQVEYLGHIVSAAGISPLPERVAAILEFGEPATVKELQTYLGMVNFYRRFIRGAAGLLRPLTDVLRGGTKGQLSWSAEMKAAFAASKVQLAQVARLAHPDPAAELVLAVDASDHHVGAVLQQKVEGGLQPLSFFSKKLEPAQQRYSAFDRELLAAYLAVRHFRWALEGRSFHIMTDHKPLTFALHRTTDAWSARQQRHLAYVAEYTSDIRHVKGVENVVADALSRPPTSPADAPLSQLQPVAAKVAAAVELVQGGKVTVGNLATEQPSCSETMALAGRPDVQKVSLAGHQLLCMVNGAGVRPLVPLALRRAVFDSVHCLAHPGIRATVRMVTARYVWPGCSGEVASWVRNCLQCATGKPGQVEKAPVVPLPVPAARFSQVHVDLVGPLPPSAHGHTYLFTMIDRSTRWPEVVPLLNIAAQTVVDAFVSAWVARFGVPEIVISDRGTQFTSASWECMCRKLGIQHSKTSAYHPQTNGLVERFHRQLKEALRARECGSDWLEHLPMVLLGLRSAPKEEAKVSSAECAYGVPLALPGGAGLPVPLPAFQEIPSTIRSYAEVAASPPSRLQGVSFVFVRKGPPGGPLGAKFSGPFRVAELRAKIALLDIGERREWVSVDRLKPFLGKEPVVPALPPARGRPRKKAVSEPVVDPLEEPVDGPMSVAEDR